MPSPGAFIFTVDAFPGQGAVAEGKLKVLISGNAFTVTNPVEAGADVHPLPSVTVTLYIPPPAVVILALVVFCVVAVKLPGPLHE